MVNGIKDKSSKGVILTRKLNTTSITLIYPVGKAIDNAIPVITAIINIQRCSLDFKISEIFLKLMFSKK